MWERAHWHRGWELYPRGVCGRKQQRQALADLGHKGTRWEDAGWLRATGGRVEWEGLGRTGPRAVLLPW